MNKKIAICLAFAMICGCGEDTKTTHPNPPSEQQNPTPLPQPDPDPVSPTQPQHACAMYARICDGNGYRVCLLGDKATYWTDIIPCENGSTCINGVCFANTRPHDECQNECTQAGQRECIGDGFRWCVKDHNNCLYWSEISKCAADTTCQYGICIANETPPSCQNPCATEGHKECSGNGFKICTWSNAGCLKWSQNIACDNGTQCINGTCTVAKPQCENTCQREGDVQCVEEKYQLCRRTNTGCLEWDKPQNCQTGMKCSENACVPYVPSCQNTCDSQGKTVCEGNGYKVCTQGSTGCLAWSETIDCNNDESCTNGSCIKNAPVCQDKCTENGAQCKGTQIQFCERQSDGCLAWDSPQNCPNNGTCSQNKCIEPAPDISETQYIINTEYSPITKNVVNNIKAIGARGKHDDNSFIKIGSRHLSSDSKALYCFSNAVQSEKLDLGNYAFLADTVLKFQTSFDAYIRDSVMTGKNHGSEHAYEDRGYFEEDKRPYITQELDATNPRYAIIAYGDSDIVKYGRHKYNENVDPDFHFDDGYFGGAELMYQNLLILTQDLIATGIIPVFVGLAPRHDPYETYMENGSFGIEPEYQAENYVQLFDAVIRGTAEYLQVPYVRVFDTLEALPNHGLADDKISLATSGSACILTDEGLKIGTNNYNMHLLNLLNRVSLAYESGTPADADKAIPYQGSGTKSDPWIVTQIPYTHSATTEESTQSYIVDYPNCAPSYWRGNETYYKFTINETKRLRIFMYRSPVNASGNKPDLGLHLLKNLEIETEYFDQYETPFTVEHAQGCIKSGTNFIEAKLNPGTYYIVIDTYWDSSKAGTYLLGVLECDPGDTACAK